MGRSLIHLLRSSGNAEEQHSTFANRLVYEYWSLNLASSAWERTSDQSSTAQSSFRPASTSWTVFESSSSAPDQTIEPPNPTRVGPSDAVTSDSSSLPPNNLEHSISPQDIAVTEITDPNSISLAAAETEEEPGNLFELDASLPEMEDDWFDQLSEFQSSGLQVRLPRGMNTDEHLETWMNENP